MRQHDTTPSTSDALFLADLTQFDLQPKIQGPGPTAALLLAKVPEAMVLQRPPRSDVSGVEALRSLWMNADLDAIEMHEIAVQRTFSDFEDFWTTSVMSATVSETIAAMAPGDAELLKMRMRARLPADVTGRITHGARANAIRGRVPR